SVLVLVTSDGGTMPYFSITPRPSPFTLWQGAQLIWKYLRPLSSDRASAGCGFAIAPIESSAAGVPMRPYSNPGAADPYTGTDICGLPRGGMLSAADSHGSIFGCCLKSVNHEHPASTGTTASITTRRAVRPTSDLRPSVLSLTANLLRPVLAHHVHRLT